MSKELRGARELVAKTLTGLGYEPKWQDIAPTETGDLRDVLRKWVDESGAVIQLVGHCYGFEPPTVDPEFGPVSYTQFEAIYARRREKKVWYIILAPEHTTEAVADEPKELRELQEAYRERVTSDDFLYHPSASLDQTKNIILQLDDKLKRLRLRWKLWATAALALLVIAVVGVWYVKRDTGRLRTDLSEVKKDVGEVKAVFARERKFMALILARANQRIKEWENMTPGQRFDLALDAVAREQKIPTEELRDLLDLYVQRVDADPDAEAEDKYYVLMRKQAYEQAAQLAGSEAQSAETRMKQHVARKDAAKVVMRRAAEEEETERKRAVEFFKKEGAAFLSAIQYEAALRAYQKAAALLEKTADPLGWAEAQEWVAFIDSDLARYDQAEPLRKEVLRLREEQLGPDDPALARALSGLAHVYYATNRLREAEPLLDRSLEVAERSYGPEHPEVGMLLGNLAQLYLATNRLAEAEPLMERALNIAEQRYESEHPTVARALTDLAQLYKAMARLEEAEALIERALKIDERSYGPEHPRVALNLNQLALLYKDTNRLPQAESLIKRALKIDEKSFGLEHPNVAADLNNLAQLYQDTNRLAEAEPLMGRVLKIAEKSYGPEDPHVAIAINNLAQLYQDTNRAADAAPLMERALKIDENSYGPKHPNVATDLNNLARLYHDTNRLAEAEPLMERALKIDENSYGPEHPNVATDLNNLAQLFKARDRLTEAEPLARRSVAILLRFIKTTGHPHPHLETVIANYKRLLSTMDFPQAEIDLRLATARAEAGLALEGSP